MKAKITRNIIYVDTPEKASQIVKFLMGTSISFIGVDLLSKYKLLNIDQDDIRSIKPLLLFLVIAEPIENTKYKYHKIAIDMQKEKVRSIIKPIFGLPVCFVGYKMHELFYAIFKLHFPEPMQIWDIYIYAKASILGKYHKKYYMNDQEKAEELENIDCDLDNLCLENSVINDFSMHEYETIKKKESIQDISDKDIREVINITKAIAQLYPLQFKQANSSGILQHLLKIEMPYIKSNAQMEWHGGIKFNINKAKKLKIKCKQDLKKFKKKLSKYNLSCPPDKKELTRFFGDEGLLHLFPNKIFSSDKLFENKNAHSIIPTILSSKTTDTILNQLKKYQSNNISTDGRLHPQYHQLGQHTGRINSKEPPIQSLHRFLRYLIEPEEGHSIGQCDFSQFEVGIMACVCNDKDLIKLVNEGDAYVYVAKHFFWNELPKSAQKLSDKKFKKKYKKYRNQMKHCINGIFNGITTFGLAEILEFSESDAETFLQCFYDLFPNIESGIKDIKDQGLKNGYATTITGLKRYRGEHGELTEWEKEKLAEWEERWMVNFLPQGNGAIIYKAVAIKLDALYKEFDAKIIIPMHDNIVFECPTEHVDTVKNMTKRVMKETMKIFFPKLKPKVTCKYSKYGWGNSEDIKNIINAK